ncbi:hypothetical protein AVEN_275357-1 [Araneus ventricosus]|uniref:Uncharacterized protein n=1 Tax=Araneus ventricosus TaxID=182803 RepID=A0A4Y2DBP4_ARAVE|nr:hypothetical protein AVEN_275357-1 [Araneus ventricosus]
MQELLYGERRNFEPWTDNEDDTYCSIHALKCHTTPGRRLAPEITFNAHQVGTHGRYSVKSCFKPMAIQLRSLELENFRNTQFRRTKIVNHLERKI